MVSNLKTQPDKRKKDGVDHSTPHHHFFVVPAVGCSCSFQLPCAIATSDLSSFSFRFADDWRTMQRDIASCPQADGAVNHFLQPTGNRGEFMSNNFERSFIQTLSMRLETQQHSYTGSTQHCHGAAASAIGSTSITPLDTVF